MEEGDEPLSSFAVGASFNFSKWVISKKTLFYECREKIFLLSKIRIVGTNIKNI